MQLISWHYNNPLDGNFSIEKTRKLLIRKNCWPTLRHQVEAYVKGGDMCLALKAVSHKRYGNLQSLPLLTYRWKDLLMDFVTSLPISTKYKRDNYDFILVIVYQLMKMVHYKPVKITINAAGLIEVIIKIVIHHHGLPNSIVTDKGSLFTSKFWLLLYYFFGTKPGLSTAFYPQTDRQTKCQNSIIEVYLQTFVYFEQNN